MKKGPRYNAIEILCQWEKSASPIDQIFARQMKNSPLADSRDVNLSTAIVYGVLRWRSYLDWILKEFSSHSLSKMKPRTLNALRVGLFQLVFMDRIPAAAAINETVAALQAARQPQWLTSYVNGLLRAVDRQYKMPGPQQDDAAMPEADRLSHPSWLLARWCDRYGHDQAVDICRTNNIIPSLCLRVNTRTISLNDYIDLLLQKKISVSVGRFSPAAVRLKDYRGAVADIPGYNEGYFTVQDEAAQLVSLLLFPLLPGRSSLDGCAGLGGKTSHLAQILSDNDPGPETSQITAVEPSPARLGLLKENLRRLRLESIVNIIKGDLDSIRPDIIKPFDNILIDAPCSGLGVIRRHPDIRWQRTQEDLRRYQQKQFALLESAAHLAAPGAVVVYAVCSMEPEESDQVVHKFLAEHKDFKLSDCGQYLPATAADLVDGQGFFRTIPDNKGLDGFSAARLEKN